MRGLTSGELAQWLEQRNHNPLVPSSNLGFATIYFPVFFVLKGQQIHEKNAGDAVLHLDDQFDQYCIWSITAKFSY